MLAYTVFVCGYMRPYLSKQKDLLHPLCPSPEAIIGAHLIEVETEVLQGEDTSLESGSQ